MSADLRRRGDGLVVVVEQALVAGAAAGTMRVRSWGVGGSAVGLVRALAGLWEGIGSVAALEVCLEREEEGRRCLLVVCVVVGVEEGNSRY